MIDLIKCIGMLLFLLGASGIISSCVDSRYDLATVTGEEERNAALYASPTPVREADTDSNAVPQNFGAHVSSQTRFGIERPITSPVPIPLAIWTQIFGNESNLSIRRNLEERNDASLWVEGSVIDLDRDKNPDYIVIATMPPLMGANMTTFWLFAGKSNGDFALVFSGSSTEIDMAEAAQDEFRPFTMIKVGNNESMLSRYRYYDGRYHLISEQTVRR